MSKSKQAKAAKRQQVVQQPTPPAQDEEMEDEVESDVDILVDGELEKDESESEEELELERLVFGDSAGFREGLKDFALDAQEDAEESVDDASGLEGLDDAQVGTHQCTTTIGTSVHVDHRTAILHRHWRQCATSNTRDCLRRRERERRNLSNESTGGVGRQRRRTDSGLASFSTTIAKTATDRG